MIQILSGIKNLTFLNFNNFLNSFKMFAAAFCSVVLTHCFVALWDTMWTPSRVCVLSQRGPSLIVLLMFGGGNVSFKQNVLNKKTKTTFLS